MNDFDYEVMMKKKTARSARHKKNGSRSKKCSLPSDNLTPKQWKERNGRIMTYQLNVPMNWEEFKKLPLNIQKMYVERLIKKYSVGATKLAEMFGVSAVTVYAFCNKPEIGIKFAKGRKMSEEQIENFYNFIGLVKNDAPIMNACDAKENAKEEPVEEVMAEPSEQKDMEEHNKESIEADENIEEPKAVAIEENPHSTGEIKFVNEIKSVAPMMLNSFSLNINGRFERDMLFNSLAYMIPEGSNVKIEIECEIIS